MQDTEHGFDSQAKNPWSRKWQPVPVFLPNSAKSRGRGVWQATTLESQRVDTTEHTHKHTVLSIKCKNSKLSDK